MLTPDETKVLVGLLVIGLTIGGFLVIIVFGIACALSGLTNLDDMEPDEGLNDIQQELDAWRKGDGRASAPLHPALRESGYYQSFEHRRREAKVDRAMGGAVAA